MENLFPDAIVCETDHFRVAQDWEIPIPGFLIISPIRDMRSVADFSLDEEQDFIHLLCKLRRGMLDLLHIKEVYLFQNEDSEHNFQLWVFPRLDWMEQFGRKIESVRPIMEFAKANHKTNEVIDQVNAAVEKMRFYMDPKT